MDASWLPDVVGLGLTISGAICWTITYILLIIFSFRDSKKIFIPILAVSLNIAWEIMYSFLFIDTVSLLQQIVNIIWFLFDCPIIFFTFRNYVRTSEKSISRTIFYLFCNVLFGIYFNLFFIAFTPDNPATYSAYVINLFMSCGYLFSEQQAFNFWIALFKMIGTALFSLLAFLFIIATPYMILTYISIFIIDLIYTVECFRLTYSCDNLLMKDYSVHSTTSNHPQELEIKL